MDLNPVNLENQLKFKLSHCFWVDSTEFYYRAHLLINNPETSRNSFYAKIFVDLFMGAECALKSLIISLSNETETPEKAYKILRSCSHNLDKLYKKVRERADKELLSTIEIDLLKKANTVGVSQRYELTSFLMWIQEDYIERGKRSGKISSILNDTFIKDFCSLLKKLNDTTIDLLEESDLNSKIFKGHELTRIKKRQIDFFNSREYNGKKQ